RGDAIGSVRMADADPPRSRSRRPSAHDDVTAGIDRERVPSRRGHLPSCALHGPALNESRGIESTVGSPPARIEGSLAIRRGAVDEQENLAEVGVDVCFGKTTIGQARHLAVRQVRTESLIDVVQPGDSIAQRARCTVVSQVERDDGPHHGFRVDDHPAAVSSADWSDCLYAPLVYVAPLIRSMLAVCACSASDRSIGSTMLEIRDEWPSPFGSCRAVTSVTAPPEIVTWTWTSPYRMDTSWPVKVPSA